MKEKRYRVSLSLKIDPEMKAALERAASMEYTSTASIVKQAVNQYLCRTLGDSWITQNKIAGRGVK